MKDRRWSSRPPKPSKPCADPQGPQAPGLMPHEKTEPLISGLLFVALWDELRDTTAHRSTAQRRKRISMGRTMPAHRINLRGPATRATPAMAATASGCSRANPAARRASEASAPPEGPPACSASAWAWAWARATRRARSRSRCSSIRSSTRCCSTVGVVRATGAPRGVVVECGVLTTAP